LLPPPTVLKFRRQQADPMPRAIAERHEIVVETDESVFVFTADSREGRLLIQQKRKRGSSEICSLSLANPDELEAFFEGLRRVFSSTGGARERPVPPRQPPPGRGTLAAARQAGATLAAGRQADDDRDEVIARARGRNAKAFEPWTRSEEEDVRRRFEAGDAVETIARTHNRSPKAIRMRLERLGAAPRQ
jgi:hypothetical protein